VLVVPWSIAHTYVGVVSIVVVVVVVSGADARVRVCRFHFAQTRAQRALSRAPTPLRARTRRVTSRKIIFNPSVASCARLARVSRDDAATTARVARP